MYVCACVARSSDNTNCTRLPVNDRFWPSDMSLVRACRQPESQPFFFFATTTDAIAGALWAPATNPRYILFCYINLIVITDNHLALAVANTSAAQMYEHRRQREQLLQSRCVVWGRKGEIVLRRGCIGMLRGLTIQELPIFFFFCYSPLNCSCCCCCCLHNLRFVHKFTYVL